MPNDNVNVARCSVVRGSSGRGPGLKKRQVPCRPLLDGLQLSSLRRGAAWGCGGGGGRAQLSWAWGVRDCSSRAE